MCANFTFLLLLYNKTLSKHVTTQFCLYLGNVDTSANHFRNAPPVGGHTCITAGEQGEPAVVLYERINPSVFVPLFRGTSKEFAEGVSGEPTAPGYATNSFNLSGRCGSSYGDR